LVKRHLSYTVEEVARLFGIHRNTVREWIKRGLPTCDNRRPTLLVGRHLFEFLRARELTNRRRCAAGEIYCMKCRQPRRPAGGMVDYVERDRGPGNLVGICPSCETLMFRRVNRSKLEEVTADLHVSAPEHEKHIVDRAQPSVNSDL
jgi:hypothetical protein